MIGSSMKDFGSHNTKEGEWKGHCCIDKLPQWSGDFEWNASITNYKARKKQNRLPMEYFN